MPFAGGQVKKSLEGLDVMKKGGRYRQTDEGNSLQFAVDQENPLNWLQAGVFGKWALQEGRDYFDGGKALDAKRTKTYETLVNGGVKNTSAYQIISNIQSKKKGGEKRAAIRWTALPKEQQAILYYDLAAGDEDKALMDYFNMRAKSGKGKAEDIGEVYDCLSRMAEHGSSVPPQEEHYPRNQFKRRGQKAYLPDKGKQQCGKGKQVHFQTGKARNQDQRLSEH